MIERLEQARQWLRSTLGVVDVDLQPASSDASFRRYFRIRLDGGSKILMDAPPDREDCRPYVAVSDLLASAEVHVPAIYARDLACGFLLLEDLGQRSYLDALDADSASSLYGEALDTLLRMQVRVPPDSVPGYDTALVMQELALFDEWFLRRHLGIDTAGALGKALSEIFRVLAERFEQQAKVFVHRDYHSRNLMHTRVRNPGVLDFQDAVAGPAAYDVVSLLRDVYIEWPAARVEEWLIEYHGDALSRGVPVSADPRQFLCDVDFVGAQRHLKIAGIFCRLFYRDAKPDYLRDIPLTLRYLMAECERQPALAALRQLLDDLDVIAKLERNNARTLARLAELSP
ncbi:MAG: phosphotransferase [Gammaproteobacteria bacterium]|nr:phosphotransferase [Gammaproteobacteria bacterium]NIP89522.1 phosphotransferase [Gammaproteobacteria bacterium]NIR24356.1 phosphotransferase [Gammaproteobacteria bacterium]NIS06025.1 phosphotransferase [Gammaproteobacteria bacterium]NIU41263.1 phosphotransferase [Gammaproteobacteria bacterium]